MDGINNSSQSMSWKVLGGAEEIGANCLYLNIGGTGLLIDAGLHPKMRNASAFPALENIHHDELDALLITHAHTDHIGGLPFVLKHHPYLQLITTPLTRDLAGIMLGNTIKLIKQQINQDNVTRDALSLYTKETAEYISTVFNTFQYKEDFYLQGKRGLSPVQCTFHDAGHIPGSSGIHLQWNGLSIFHTGDVQFKNQSLIPGARFPRHHVDVLFCESTNGSAESIDMEKQRDRAELARFINTISNQNGSILIPAFALGKTQEILVILHELQRKGAIPQLPIYTGGMGKTISAVIDRYCYTSPRIKPGFELSDIPQIAIPYDELEKAPYFSTPSIVIASSGMMNPGTISYKLAHSWMQKRNFGIAFIGWQEPESPGFALSVSEPQKTFSFGPFNCKRVCAIERFRFSAHADREDLIEFICDVRPKKLVLLHGDPEACESIAYSVSQLLDDKTKISIPECGKHYSL